MYICESLHGITIDSDRSLKDLVSRHHQHSKNPANIYYISNGVKRFLQKI